MGSVKMMMSVRMCRLVFIALNLEEMLAWQDEVFSGVTSLY